MANRVGPLSVTYWALFNGHTSSVCELSKKRICNFIHVVIDGWTAKVQDSLETFVQSQYLHAVVGMQQDLHVLLAKLSAQLIFHVIAGSESCKEYHGFVQQILIDLHDWTRPKVKQESKKDDLVKRLLCWCTLANSICSLMIDPVSFASRHVLKSLSKQERTIFIDNVPKKARNIAVHLFVQKQLRAVLKNDLHDVFYLWWSKGQRY